jgi:hypothetical protein
MQTQARPRGVGILAYFYIIGSIIGIVLGALSVSGAVKESGSTVLSLAASVYTLVAGYGLRKGKGWGWTISVIGIFIGFAMGTYAIIFTLVPSITSISNQVGSDVAGMLINIIIIVTIISFGIEVLILYYLYRPHVKTYFGKAAPKSSSPYT